MNFNKEEPHRVLSKSSSLETNSRTMNSYEIRGERQSSSYEAVSE